MEHSFSNKVVLITGAGSGIGLSTALLFARHKARVVVSDIDETGGKEAVRQIESAGGQAHFVKADVGKPTDCEKMVEETVRKYGGLHVAVNNAGIGGASAPVGEYPVEEWDKVVRINLSGVFYGMRHQIPAILKSGGGAIVNIASILGSVGFEQSCAYVAAKHGILGLTKNAALEYATQNLRVNSIGPAFISTPLLSKNLTEEQLQFITTLHPMGRLGNAEEVAELILWLSSDKASFATGSYYPLDGGYLAK